jgi:TPR repeat protein
LCLEDPDYGNRNYVGASLYYRQASALSQGLSSFILSITYEKGDGFTKNIPEAIKWLKLSAKQGYPTAMAQYGWRLLNAIDVESHQQKGLDYIQSAADRNNPIGLCYLGKVRFYTIHSYKSKEDAFSHFTKAASFGHAYSIFMLGRCYKEGWGTQSDIFKAIKCYKRATNLGCGEAFFHFGQIYIDGDRITQNKQMGLQYWQCGASLKDEYCLCIYALYLYYWDGIAETKAEGFKMIKESADLGCTLAQIKYNELTTGKTDPKAEADYHFEQSKDGNEASMARYSIVSCFGYGTEQNLITAIYWAEKGKVESHELFEREIDNYYQYSDLNEEEKQIARGMAEGIQFEFGYRRERNYQNAFERYKTVAQHGIPSAMVCVGYVQNRAGL